MKILKKAAMIIFMTLLVGTVSVCTLSQKSDMAMSEYTAENAVSPHQQNSEYNNDNDSTKNDNSEKFLTEEEDNKVIPPIKLDKTELSLGVGEDYTFNTNTAAEKWISGKDKIIKVKNGKISAKSVGKTTVKAVDADGNISECKITVKKEPEWVAFEKYSLTLGIGETYELQAILPKDAASAGRTFSSSDDSVVKMLNTNWTGKFKAVSAGTAVVKVKLYNGKEAACEITVKDAPEKVTISRPTLTLGVGETYSLKCGLPAGSGSAERTFRSSDESIIKMTKTNWTGEFKALKEGTAWVTVRTYNGKESSCKIVVKKAPEEITLSKNEIELTVGQKYTLTSTVNDGSASNRRTYSASDDSIVKMTKTEWAGQFEAIAEGETWITVSTYNGIETSCLVTVKEKTKEIEIKQASLSETGTPTGGHVTAPDGTPWSAESENTVVYTDDDSIRLTNNAAVMEIGEEYTIVGSSTSNSGLSFTSTDEDVATVDEDGTVHAVGVGNANIIINSENGTSGKLVVLVLGDKESRVYTDISEIHSLLNSVELNPIKTNYSEIDNMVDAIFAEILTDDMTNAEKVQACYDYLAQKCTYGYDGYKAVNIDGYMSDEDKEIAEFSYCILKDRLGTCENFSAAFVVMTRRLGFNSNVVYGQVAMSAGGYDGHYWTDIEIDNKHYLFDPQVERNCLGEDNEVYHYFFGMRPELNYDIYRYEYMTRVHGFKIFE